MQIAGYAAGGLLIASIGPGRAIGLSAALIGLSALVTWFGLKPRRPKATGRASFRATREGNRALLGVAPTRTVLLAGWLPNGLIVGAEALYIPLAGDTASILFVPAAVGMLVGDVVFGRWVSPRRLAMLVNPLHTLLAVPYLMFFARPALWLAAIAVAIASVGYAATLGLQQRLTEAVPQALRGQAFGLDGSGRMSFQAIGALCAGTLAELIGAAQAMTVTATASLFVTALLWKSLGQARPPVAAIG